LFLVIFLVIVGSRAWNSFTTSIKPRC